MDRFNQFTQRLKFVKLSDILSLFPMLAGLLYSLILKLSRKPIWLICERKGEARDNGYWFYKFICENHKEIMAVYAIDKKCVDYPKVKNLGRVIQFGSVKHWAYYFAADKNISSQKEGKPNAAICFVLEVYLKLRPNRVYLKHGITKDYQRWIFKDISQLNMLCCASRREQEYIIQNFGYTKDEVYLTGLCRFDNLLTNHSIKRQILVMPTMREWLRIISSDTLKYESSKDFCKSEYYITWSHLLKNPDLHKMLNENNVDLVFYPHPTMQKYLNQFENNCNRVIFASARDYDMQRLLMESAALVTDYSSIFFDFAYMKKPLIYYQFDYEKYRRGQYQQGYFSYQEDGFGTVAESEDKLLSEISKMISHNLTIEKKYEDRIDQFFEYNDRDNCKRTYEAIVKRWSK